MALRDDIQAHTKRRVLTGLLFLVFFLFFTRLYQLQLVTGEVYDRKSEENSIRTLLTDPVRGTMIDRNGVLVVDNRPAFTVTIMPYEFRKTTIPRLAALLSLDTAFIADRLRKGEAYSRFAPVKIQRDIDFRTLAILEENRDRLPGVEYQVESKRFYTTPARASHLLGYTKEISELQLRQLGGAYAAGDVAGATGIEAGYEKHLRGEKGAEFSVVNVRGQNLGRYEGGKNDVLAKEGNDLLLTLDFGLQQLAESLMTGRRGAVVALDPTDGGIIAMASTPDYPLARFSGVTPPELWKSLNADPATPLFNRATLTKYPPGSTFKMVLAAAALESDVVTPSWRVSCSGAFRFGNKTFKDLHVHGSVDMVSAIQKSCNVYFYQLMLKTGLETWSNMAREFGFGQMTGIDIFEETPGLLPTTEFMNRRYGPTGWTRGFLPSLGIGQGELGVTPLQMACFAMALANRGHLYQPHAVLAIRDRSLNRPDTLIVSSRFISLAPGTWEVIREGMRRVVEEPGGTGGLARIRGMEVAGKTGTAQNPHGPDHAWFIGWAPYDDPRIAIAVVIENAGFGGSFAAPIAGQCMERYLTGGTRPPSPVLPQAIVQAGTTAAEYHR